MRAVIMRKDNIDLICSVAELSGLFEKRSNVVGFLQDVVELVAGHMNSDVCSIYLFDTASSELVLRATKGLNLGSVDSVRLKLGEGLTGLALKQLRPICEAQARENPDFKIVPQVEEDEFNSFLAVPIRRGLTRIGVISLQHQKTAFFDEHDVKALKAIASQMAATLENAMLLMEIHSGSAGQVPENRSEPKAIVPGISAGEGVGWGQAVHLDDADTGSDVHIPREPSVDAELARFERAIEISRVQLEALQFETEKNLSDVAGLIFSSHLLMLRDEEFSGQMLDAVRDGMDTASAVRTVVGRYVQLFSGMNNPRLQEKAQDVKDLGHRILRNVSGSGDQEQGDYTGQVVIAANLYPSELIKLSAQHAEGLVLSGTAVTGHISVLSRSLDLPVVFTRDPSIHSVPERSFLIVDGHQGKVLVDPDEVTISRYRGMREEQQRLRIVDPDVPEQAHSACGTRVRVMANVNLLNDIRYAKRNKAEGVGLYRSEFPFIVRNDFPSEEEQYSIYRKIIGSMEGEEIVLRTLDIGGDKLGRGHELAYTEANPFLGERGVRFSLANREIFSEQIRAMLRAGHNGDLAIMFPMVAGCDEFLEARDVVHTCMDSLKREGLPFHEQPKIGAMVELPSAIEVAGELSEAADFLCVGTNDLIMYLLGVDRTNERVSDLYVQHHPSVLRSIARLVGAVDRPGDKLSICGEAAADPELVPFFIGLGVRRLSVEPRLVPRVKRLLAGITVHDAEQISRRMLACSTVSEIRKIITEVSGDSA